MAQSTDKTIYYDLSRTLSKQRLFNFVIGARGCGKTFAAKVQAIKNFLRRGEQFFYIRRYDTDLPAAFMRDFFTDIVRENIFPECEFSAWHGEFKINHEVAGHYFPLSKQQSIKSTPHPKVSLIIFDEFIIDKGMIDYIPDEVHSFLELYSTIARMRDVTVLFLSNAMTVVNPYFLYWDIVLEPGQRTYLRDEISVEVLENQKFVETVKQTRFGKLIDGTDFGRYAIENKFLLDTNDFIEKMPSPGVYLCTFLFYGQEAGFYICRDAGKYYLSEKVDQTCTRRYTVNIGEHTETTLLASKSRNLYVYSLVDNFCRGKLRFETMRIKNLSYQTLKRLI